MEFEPAEPNNDRGRSPDGQQFDHAFRQMEIGRFEEALSGFKASALDNPHFKTYERIGECYAFLGRFTEAIPYLAAATTLNPGARAPRLLAEAWLALGFHQKAIEAADIALLRVPGYRKALEVRAAAEAQIGRQE